MAFDIDDPETEKLVHQLASMRGCTPEDAILIAVTNELRASGHEPASGEPDVQPDSPP